MELSGGGLDRWGRGLVDLGSEIEAGVVVLAQECGEAAERLGRVDEDLLAAVQRAEKALLPDSGGDRGDLRGTEKNAIVALLGGRRQEL